VARPRRVEARDGNAGLKEAGAQKRLIPAGGLATDADLRVEVLDPLDEPPDTRGGVRDGQS